MKKTMKSLFALFTLVNILLVEMVMAESNVIPIPQPKAGQIYKQGEAIHLKADSLMKNAMGCISLEGMDDDSQIQSASWVCKSDNKGLYPEMACSMQTRKSINLKKEKVISGDFKGKAMLVLLKGRVKIIRYTIKGGGCANTFDLR